MSLPVKVVVTGASGLLGRAIFDKLRGLNDKFSVSGWALSRTCSGKYERVNLMDPVELEEAFCKSEPKIMIHCAAVRHPDKVSEDYEYAWALNVGSTKNLASLCKLHNCHFIYMSTDYVFDGQQPPYLEHSVPHPLNQYGELKLEGERIVQESGAAYTILRVPLLYGDVEFLGEGAVDAILKAVLNRDNLVSMSDYEIRYPTHVLDVANIIVLLLDYYFKEPEKIRNKCLHWSGDEPMTKYDMARCMGEVFGLSCDHLRPTTVVDESAAVSRPHNAHLDTSCVKALGGKNQISFKEGIKQSLSSHVRSL